MTDSPSNSDPFTTRAIRSACQKYMMAVKRIEGAGYTYGRNIFDADWDTCLVLDACRHDLYEEVRGPTESAISPASVTGTWVPRTFDAETAAETVYVTGNPNSRRVADLPWKAFVELWDRGWDSDLETVPPDVVTKYAVAAREAYPSARLVVHYMQPHHPFTPAGRALGGTWDSGDSVWQRLEDGELDTEAVWAAYRANLETALSEVDRLIAALDDERVLITSDHGNAVGEYGMYGHPRGLAIGALRRVPWDVVDSGPRDDTTDIDISSLTIESTGWDEDELEDRLRSLGYR